MTAPQSEINNLIDKTVASLIEGGILADAQHIFDELLFFEKFWGAGKDSFSKKKHQLHLDAIEEILQFSYHVIG